MASSEMIVPPPPPILYHRVPNWIARALLANIQLHVKNENLTLIF